MGTLLTKSLGCQATGLHWWWQPWGTMQSREWHIALMVWVDAVTQEQESCGVAGLCYNSDLEIPRTQLDCWMLVWVVQCWWFGIFSGQDIWYHLVCFGGLFLDKLSSSNWLQTSNVAKYDLEFQILCYPPPSSWNYRCVSSTPSLCGTGDKTQGLILASWARPASVIIWKCSGHMPLKQYTLNVFEHLFTHHSTPVVEEYK